MRRILFLTSVPPDIVVDYVANNDWSNTMLPELLSKISASVTIKLWRDEDIISTILSHDTVTFLWAEDYIRHPTQFAQFLETADSAIRTSATPPRVVNNLALVRWNVNKKYLLDMKGAGFNVPATEIIEPEGYQDASALHNRLLHFQSSGPIVLKPAISASSNNTHLVNDIASLLPVDIAYLNSCTEGSLQSSLVAQQFEPAIAHGEYSFVFVGDKLTHAALKKPKQGEFRCQAEFGGRMSHVPLEEIEERILSTIKLIFETLKGWFGEGATKEMGYLRIDGLITDTRGFVLMEVEAIEPELSLEMGGLQEMLSILVSKDLSAN
ncbi:hypothetical protein BJX70DRAFT_118758 [Aspergillus crustosus]